MRASAVFLVAVSLAAQNLPAQNLAAPPWVRQAGVWNAASHLPAALPGGGLAPGSLAVVEGLRFVPSDVAVDIEAGGQVRSATIIRATAERIDIRMPDFRQAGPAKLFVRSKGKRSVGSDIVLTPSSFGIFTANDSGWGAAASVVDPEDPPATLPIVRPGGKATISGTGLGHARAAEIQVIVAGRKAGRVRRESRNGVDQLSFEIPALTPASCAVPVVVRTGAYVSNTAVLETSPCEPANWYSQLRGAGRRSGLVTLLRSDVILELDPGKPVHFSLDNLIAGFQRRSQQHEPGPFDLLPPAGACVSYAGPIDAAHLVLPSLVGDGSDASFDPGPEIEAQTSALEDLDAGASIGISGADGARRALRAAPKPRIYTAILGGNPPVSRIPATPLFLAPGKYRIGIDGGRDVGRADVTLDVADVIVWRNRDTVTQVDRRAGVDLEWNLPAGYLPLLFAWNLDRRSSFGGIAVCRPPAGALRFHMPAEAVANLPATPAGGSDLSLGFLGIAAIPQDPPRFDAPGIDSARALFVSLSGRSVVVR